MLDDSPGIWNNELTLGPVWDHDIGTVGEGLRQIPRKLEQKSPRNIAAP